MNKERFIERILETENLTDELEDSDASWLLHWGVGHLDRVLQGAEDEETAGSRVNALMAVMRKINRLVGNYSDKSRDSLVEDLAALHDLYVAAFGPANAPPAQQEMPPSTDDSRLAKKHRKGCFFSLLACIKPPDKSQLSNGAPGSEKIQPAELEPQPPSQAGFETAAAHLAQLPPRQALEFLAQDFFPIHS